MSALDIPRRTMLGAGAAALAFPAAAAPSADLKVRGSRAYSESAMVISMSRDGRSAVSLRFCRFPEAGYMWIWCHVLLDGQLFAFTTHDARTGPERLAGALVARYASATAALGRVGRGTGLSGVSMTADLRGHRSRAAPHGPGSIPIRIDGRFTPGRSLAATVVEGRDEVYGLFEADVTVGGSRLRHRGPAKFHEQRQEAPRFDTPFAYGWFSTEAAEATTLLVPQGAAGGWQIEGTEAALAEWRLPPAGPRRASAWKLKDGRVLNGELESLVRYQIPIYGLTWNGSFVRGQVEGQPLVGALNDWTHGPDIYAAAAARWT